MNADQVTIVPTLLFTNAKANKIIIQVNEYYC